VVQEKSFGLSEEQVLRGVKMVSKYLHEGRELYHGSGQSLRKELRMKLISFFSPMLLDQIRTVELVDERVANPEFYAGAQAKGYRGLPDLTHMASITFVDTIVFHEPIEERRLFHGLVHATQVQLLGLERFAELFVRGYARTSSYFMVPVKALAFELDARFAKNPAVGFSVEDEVWRWVREYRY